MHEVLQLMAELTKDRRFAEIQLPLGLAEGGTNMCEVLDRYWNSGITTGRQEGVTSTQTLFYRLIEENRMDDLRRASSDREYLQQLLEEDGLLPSKEQSRPQ